MERVSCLNIGRLIKKFLAALLSVIIVFILFSCNSGNENDNGDGPIGTPKPERKLTGMYLCLQTKLTKTAFL